MLANVGSPCTGLSWRCCNLRDDAHVLSFCRTGSTATSSTETGALLPGHHPVIHIISTLSTCSILYIGSSIRCNGPSRAVFSPVLAVSATGESLVFQASASLRPEAQDPHRRSAPRHSAPRYDEPRQRRLLPSPSHAVSSRLPTASVAFHPNLVIWQLLSAPRGPQAGNEAEGELAKVSAGRSEHLLPSFYKSARSLLLLVLLHTHSQHSQAISQVRQAPLPLRLMPQLTLLLDRHVCLRSCHPPARRCIPTTSRNISSSWKASSLDCGPAPLRGASLLAQSALAFPRCQLRPD